MKSSAKLYISLIFFSIFSSSQEINQSFLNSLPDDIKKDLEEQNSNRGKRIESNYRPYLYSSKLSQAEELLKLKERLELDLIELKKRLDLDNDISTDEGLKLYGEDFFNTFQTSFMPINEPNPDSDYSLDVGDILNIQLVGQKNVSEDHTINRDGTISLDDIGKITLAGLDLNQASSAIKLKIKSTYIGTESFITLKAIRDVNVLITGNAKHPGIYTLTGNSNILHALSAAGGVSEFGSFREINLIRNDIVIETLDLYELLINGNYNLKKRIRSGDVVFVKPRKSIVKIDGAIYRPAKYEVFDEQNLSSIIEYANGMKRTADIQNISLERILDGELKTIPIVNKSQLSTIKAQDGDLIYIREHPFREAKISGAVMKPGTYIMSSNENINDLVDKAGGFTKNAYLYGAIYTNEDAKKINKIAKDSLYQEFLDNIIAASQANMSPNFDLTPIVQITKELKDSNSNGRVIIDLEDRDSIELYAVRENDHLFIPEKSNVVYVYGEVSSEGAVMYSDAKGLEYFVQKSGGYKKFADKESIYILHPNGESQLYSSKRNIFESSPQSEVAIYPGSIIFIPRELDQSTPRRLATQAYVSIIGNLGIALASLSSINNN
ncbi:SLBB domain-containing protein [Gammaproteobacteria bacterium]|nr:SLBB domain-containing protein [Gammaproteobacteria bacterium]